MMAERRLGYVQPFGGPRERPGIDDRGELAQLSQAERHGG
jgi:hypothetical protein